MALVQIWLAGNSDNSEIYTTQIIQMPKKKSKFSLYTHLKFFLFLSIFFLDTLIGIMYNNWTFWRGFVFLFKF